MCSQTDVGGQFLFSTNIKVIVSLHLSSIKWKKTSILVWMLCSATLRHVDVILRQMRQNEAQTLKVSRMFQANGKRGNLQSELLETSGAIFNANRLVFLKLNYSRVGQSSLFPQNKQSCSGNKRYELWISVFTSWLSIKKNDCLFQRCATPHKRELFVN